MLKANSLKLVIAFARHFLIKLLVYQAITNSHTWYLRVRDKARARDGERRGSERKMRPGATELHHKFTLLSNISRPCLYLCTLVSAASDM